MLDLYHVSGVCPLLVSCHVASKRADGGWWGGLQRNAEKPALNDVTGVGRWRQALLVALIGLALLTLLPMWDELAVDLGMGGVNSAAALL